MFEALQQLFTRRETELPDSEPKLAVAALLVHLAAIDGTVLPEERTAIRGAL
ncbi:MAG: TerB family tellurite resistance protein, partial [Acidobacteria bacterium]|nr:TerB family tellurite resistance protein [Acidobacteriota bacterium]